MGDYVDGSLPQDEYHRVRRHLNTCAECAREVQLEHEVRRGIRDVELPATPLALADRLVSIGEAGDTVWMRSGDAELPSARATRRRIAQGTLGSLTMMLAMVVAVGWLMAPAMPGIANLDATAAGEAGAVLPTTASTGEQDDPVVAASGRVPATISTADSDALVTATDVQAAGGAGGRDAEISADAAHLLLAGWPASTDVATTVCRASGGCVPGLVHGTAQHLALTLFASDGSPSQSLWWTPLAGIPDTARWRHVGVGTLAGAPVVGLEARVASGGVLRRWWLSTSDLHLVQVDSYSGGQLVATEAFRPGDPVGDLSCPHTFVCPAKVAGLPLVNVARDQPDATQQVRLLFAGERGAVVVVEQPGRLVGDAGASATALPAQTWQAGALVMAAAGTDADLVASVSTALPHRAAPRMTAARRVELGWRRIGGG